MGFSDVDGVGSDAGVEVSEVESKDVDYGDGDGVNEFDETFKEMNFGNGSLEYSGGFEGTGSPRFDHQSDAATDAAVDDALAGFDDQAACEADGAAHTDIRDDGEMNRFDMTTDENVGEVLAGFDDDLQVDHAEDPAERTAVFENVSYRQGQNDMGALGTCGPTSVANSLNRVTGTSDYTENEVLHKAMDNDLCNKGDNPLSFGGTTTKDVVNIIDDVKNPEGNIHTEVYEYDKALSVEELAGRLDDPGTVAMVGVDSATLWDQRGDVASSGLFQHAEAPSDHWITVDSPIRDEAGNLTGFNVIDSGGGVSEVSREKFESMYMGDSEHTVSDPTAILISNSGEGGN